MLLSDNRSKNTGKVKQRSKKEAVVESDKSTGNVNGDTQSDVKDYSSSDSDDESVPLLKT